MRNLGNEINNSTDSKVLKAQTSTTRLCIDSEELSNRHLLQWTAVQQPANIILEQPH